MKKEVERYGELLIHIYSYTSKYILVLILNDSVLGAVYYLDVVSIQVQYSTCVDIDLYHYSIGAIGTVQYLLIIHKVQYSTL